MITDQTEIIAEIAKQNIQLQAQVNVLFGILCEVTALRTGRTVDEVNKDLTNHWHSVMLEYVNESLILSEEYKNRIICAAYGL